MSKLLPQRQAYSHRGSRGHHAYEVLGVTVAPPRTSAARAQPWARRQLIACTHAAMNKRWNDSCSRPQRQRTGHASGLPVPTSPRCRPVAAYAATCDSPRQQQFADAGSSVIAHRCVDGPMRDRPRSWNLVPRMARTRRSCTEAVARGPIGLRRRHALADRSLGRAGPFSSPGWRARPRPSREVRSNAVWLRHRTMRIIGRW